MHDVIITTAFLEFVQPDVELLELAGAGHLLHHTWKTEITAEIMRFLADGKTTPGRHIRYKQG